jgi:phenylacetate-coenzyme A ligase PaaK-like adenylate-forming protein
VETTFNVQLLATFWRLWRQQWFTPQRLAEHRLRGLQSLIGHAYERVPSYRERLKCLGLHLSDISSESDLLKFPPQSKVELQSRHKPSGRAQPSGHTA